jgi:hypothetical protein
MGDTVYIQNTLNSHPEWWLRDDYGKPIPFAGGATKQYDPSVPAVRAFVADLSISLFHDREECFSTGWGEGHSTQTSAMRVTKNLFKVRRR